MSLTLLRIVLRALSLIPIATGLLSIIASSAFTPGGEPLNPSMDSEYRFVNIFWTAAGVALLWSTFDLPARRLITQLVLALAAFGGIVRLWSVYLTDWPHPVFIGTIVLELLIVPMVLWWHARTVPHLPPGTQNSS